MHPSLTSVLWSMNRMAGFNRKSLSVKSAVFTLVVVMSVFAPTVLPSVGAAQASLRDQSPRPTPFKVCIDDSDCAQLGQGNKLACFQYLCYPWKDDTHVAEQYRRKTCRKDTDCAPGQDCFRHHDKRNINKGICFDEINQCDSKADCPKGLSCCGGSCCEEPYFNQFKTLPCTSHIGCEDLGLGRFCCPRTNETSVCCDTDPNPPKATPSTLTDNGSPTSKSFQAFTSVIALTIILVLH